MLACFGISTRPRERRRARGARHQRAAAHQTEWTSLPGVVAHVLGYLESPDVIASTAVCRLWADTPVALAEPITLRACSSSRKRQAARLAWLRRNASRIRHLQV